MRLDIRLTTRRLLSRMVPILVSLCAFALLPIPQLSLQSWVESTETECPAEEDGDTAGEEIVVDSSRRHVGHRHMSKKRKCGGRADAAALVRIPRPIIGHHLFNGIRVPLRL